MTGASIGNSNIYNSVLEVSLMEMRLDPASSVLVSSDWGSARRGLRWLGMPALLARIGIVIADPKPGLPV